MSTAIERAMQQSRVNDEREIVQLPTQAFNDLVSYAEKHAHLLRLAVPALHEAGDFDLVGRIEAHLSNGASAVGSMPAERDANADDHGDRVPVSTATAADSPTNSAQVENIIAAATKLRDEYRREFQSENAIVCRWPGWIDGFDPSEGIDAAYLALDAALAKNPSPSGQRSTEASLEHEASGPVGLGPCSCPDQGCHPAEMAGKVCRRTARVCSPKKENREDAFFADREITWGKGDPK
jgi:hypothetical protein